MSTSAACLRCWPMGDSGVFAARLFSVGTVLVVNRLCRFARSRSEAVEVEMCDCMRTPSGRSGGGTSDSSRGDRREFENVMATVWRSRTWSARDGTRTVEVGVWGYSWRSRTQCDARRRVATRAPRSARRREWQKLTFVAFSRANARVRVVVKTPKTGSGESGQDGGEVYHHRSGRARSVHGENGVAARRSEGT